MSISISPVITAQRAVQGGNFSVARIDMGVLRDFISPIVGLDHFWMSGQTFAPHPHAGFSAISYLFEDSTGGMRNRDSLGNDFVAEPGELIWTQAGRGVIHDELPAENGQTVHGIQLFVNLSQKNKNLAPEVFQLKNSGIPVFADERNNYVRVITGDYRSVSSLLTLAEPFNLLDAHLESEIDLELRQGWNTLFYVLSGTLELVFDGRPAVTLKDDQVVGISAAETATIKLSANESTHVLILSGASLDEPVVAYGPFVMCSQLDINTAIERFHAGEMGKLVPLQ